MTNQMVIVMVSKTITIREEVYKLLVRLKKENESFSDLLERLAKNVNTIDLLEKMAGTIDFGDTESLIKEIRRKRESWR